MCHSIFLANCWRFVLEKGSTDRRTLRHCREDKYYMISVIYIYIIHIYYTHTHVGEPDGEIGARYGGHEMLAMIFHMLGYLRVLSVYVCWLALVG